jgi:hypothetical protein
VFGDRWNGLITKKYFVPEIFHLYSNTLEDEVLHGFEEAPVGSRLPTFRSSIVSSSSRVEMSKKILLGCFDG